jgi:diketogulonate reductase-like aldo/keto reductase
MKYAEIQGESVPTLGYGTFELEGKDCVEGVAHALELGYRHIDTAQAYENESEVGEGIHRSGLERGEIFLTTKVWYTDLSREDVLRSVEESLKKLRTDYVDLLLVHWPVDDVPLEETLNAFRALQEQGKVRLMGVSNFPLARLCEAEVLARIFCNQVEYHPFLSQQTLLSHMRKQDILLTAYSPIARGKVMEEGTLQELGSKYGKSPAQVALRWLIQQDHVAAIPKAAKASHRESNIAIFDFELTADEMEQASGLARGERLIDPEWAPRWDA